MAQIVINEVSQNYTYNIGSSSYAVVALPITASWGPGYFADDNPDAMLDATTWQRFEANQNGLEAFVSTYRSASTMSRLVEDNSYQMAMTLLTSGYDVLVCRVCSGSAATGVFESDNGTLTVKAKYPGTFGNNLRIQIQKRLAAVVGERATIPYFNLIVYVVDSSGASSAVENLSFVISTPTSATADTSMPTIDELESNYIVLTANGLTDESTFTTETMMLDGGLDAYSNDDVLTDTHIVQYVEQGINYAKTRFGADSTDPYLAQIENMMPPESASGAGVTDADFVGEYEISQLDAYKFADRQFVYTAAWNIYDLLKDRLAYSPQRIIAPWDDRSIAELGTWVKNISDNVKYDHLSPFHMRLMDVAAASRCATALLDLPRDIPLDDVYDEDIENPGYAQRLSRYYISSPSGPNGSTLGALYSSHSALAAPWGEYRYVGTSKYKTATPSFMLLMIQRAMILNQAAQYEWALPTNRAHNLKIGRLDYTLKSKYLNLWQSLEGVGINVITNIPGLGINIWGNSTLYEVPAATYQALANLSTRYLVNAVEDLVYRCGLAITFQYNNDQAYNKFYAGVTPLLDTMKNVGAIEDYYVRVAADINGLDQVNANSVIGKIYLVVNGVINNITIDLVALPPSDDINNYVS